MIITKMNKNKFRAFTCIKNLVAKIGGNMRNEEPAVLVES